MKNAAAENRAYDETLPVLVDPRLKRLPRAAIDKFERLRQAERRARTILDSLQLRRAELVEERDNATRDLNIFDRRYPNPTRIEENEETGGRKRVPYVPHERAILLTTIGSAKRELEAIAVEQRASALRFDTDDLLNWLARQGDTKFVAVAPSRFTVNRSTSLDELLEANRLEQAALRDRIAELENAPLTSAETKATMRDQVNALAERGRSDLNSLFSGGAIQWPTETIVGTSGGLQEQPFATAAQVTDALGLVAWACRDAIVAKLDAEIEQLADDTGALSAKDRASRIDEAKAKLIDVQRVGEAIAVAIERHGRIACRHCVEPMVLLDIAEA